MEASKRNRRGWDQLMAQAGHKRVVSRNARKATRTGGRKRTTSSKLQSGSRGDALMSSLRRAQSLEANNPKQSSAEADVDDDDDWEDEEDEATRSTSLRGGVRGSKPRKAARGIVKRIVRLQGSLLQASEAFDSIQAALAEGVPEVSLMIAPKLSTPASRLLQMETAAGGGEPPVQASVVHDTSATPVAADFMAANGLWRIPGPSKPQQAASLLLNSAPPVAHVAAVHDCSMCGAGAWGRYTCPRTGARLCSRGCLNMHNETKLMKFAS